MAKSRKARKVNVSMYKQPLIIGDIIFVNVKTYNPTSQRRCGGPQGSDQGPGVYREDPTHNLRIEQRIVRDYTRMETDVRRWRVDLGNGINSGEIIDLQFWGITTSAAPVMGLVFSHEYQLKVDFGTREQPRIYVIWEHELMVKPE